MPIAGQGRSWFANMLRARSFQIALALWVAASFEVFPVSRGKVPLDRPAVANLSVSFQVIAATVVLAVMCLQMGVVYLLTRRRTIPDMASRAPADALARREVWLLWTYGALVLLVGRWIGLRFFGEGIGLHLNGSLFGMTRMVSPQEVWVWAFHNFVLLAVIPYVIFRARGYSREALNLKSANLANDTLVIFVVMAIGSAFDLLGAGFFNLSCHHLLPVGSL